MKKTIRDIKTIINNIENGRTDIQQVKRTLEVMVAELSATENKK